MSVDISRARVLGDDSWFDAVESALRGSVCTRCATPSFPPRAYCWRCDGRMSPRLLPRSGRVIARTHVRVAPGGFPDAYDVGVVRLAADLHVMARFGDSAPRHGDVVSVRSGPLREDADGLVLGPVFDSDPAATLDGGTPRTARPASAAPPPAMGAPLGVTVGGVATTPFGRPDLPPEELAGQAALAAVADAGVPVGAVDAVVVGSAFCTAALGQRMLRHTPWGGRRIVNVENACASGTSALSEAAALIRAGMAEVVVAVGVDVPVRSGGGLIMLDQDDPVAGIGVTLPSLYALVADNYQARYGTPDEAFAEVVVRSRANAASNENAFRRDQLTRAEVLASRKIADPLTLFQCTPNADGAAAAVLVAEHLVRGLANAPVELAALALRSGLAKDRFTGDSVVTQLAHEAYAQAGVDARDVQVLELHDAFAPAAVTNLEHLGLAEEGTAGDRLLRGAFAGGSSGPMLNPSGGLLSRGHPPGATGLAQLNELVRQLRGERGREYGSDEVALVHTMGGTVLELETNACTVGILRRTV